MSIVSMGKGIKMAVRRQRQEIQQMFDLLDPQSQRIALFIAQKYGRRLAFRYIVRASKEQPSLILPSKNQGFLMRVSQSIRGWARSFFSSDDAEDDSRNLIFHMV